MGVEAPEIVDLTGTVLDGRYRVESVLGQGGMGTVYKAVQTSMGRPVAIKTLNPSLAAAPQFFERFKREAEVASRLRHPNIITVFEFGRSPEGIYYIVMEYLEGESLRQRVKRHGPLSLRAAVAVLEQIALGLAHAHKHQVVHRDLKPHNIMLTEVDGSEYVRVLDFGLVKALEQEDEEQLTSTGQVLGTPQYMPPEQAGGETVDQRSDLYSLTGVLYFCLTGTSPFQANTVRKALTAALTQTVPPVATHRKGAPVPRKMDEFLRKGLAKDQENRYQSCEEFIAELKGSVEGLADADLDALPEGGAEAGAREGSGSSPASSKSKRTPASAGAVSTSSSRKGSSKVIVQPGLGAAEGTRGAAPEPSDRRATAPEIPRALAGQQTAGTPARSRAPLVVGATVMAVAILGTLTWAALRAAKSEDAQQVTAQVPPTPRPPVDPPRVAPGPPGGVDPAPGPSADDVTVTLASTPAGAEVLEDGILVGKTPLKRSWKKDEVHKVTFQLAGYKPMERGYKLQQDESFDVQLEAVGKKPSPGDKRPPRGGNDGISAFE